MGIGILGQKVGMTQVYDPAGNVISVTVIQAGPCHVLQVKTDEIDGYQAVQLGYLDKPRRLARRTIYYGAYQKVYVYDSTLAGGIYKEGTSYEPFEIESGYIDPDPFYQEKLYTQIVIEATATTASVTADLVITYNNGSSDTFSAVSFTKVGSENYVYIIKPMNRAAKSFKYKITTGGANTEQIKIHRIVVFYSVGLLKG